MCLDWLEQVTWEDDTDNRTHTSNYKRVTKLNTLRQSHKSPSSRSPSLPSSAPACRSGKTCLTSGRLRSAVGWYACVNGWSSPDESSLLAEVSNCRSDFFPRNNNLPLRRMGDVNPGKDCVRRRVKKDAFVGDEGSGSAGCGCEGATHPSGASSVRVSKSSSSLASAMDLTPRLILFWWSTEVGGNGSLDIRPEGPCCALFVAFLPRYI